jgi:hypothetical protein
MTSLSMRFSRAVANGRSAPVAATRENLLVTLLRKRATAQCVGATDLEALLRSQILWSLPVFDRITLDSAAPTTELAEADAFNVLA